MKKRFVLPLLFLLTMLLPIRVHAAALTVYAETSDVKIGYAGVAVKDIVITETKAGTISSKGALELRANATNANLSFVEAAYEVTEGDIQIEKVHVSGGVIQIYIKHPSDTPSTIVLKGITMNIDRMVPKGLYSLYVGGAAIIQNYSGEQTVQRAMFDTSHYEIPNFYRVITAAPDQATINLSRSPDTILRADGTSVTMKGAESYMEDGHIMVPIVSIAEVFGVPRFNIIWDDSAKTVTIIRNNYVVQFKADSNIVAINGAHVTMPKDATRKNGVVYVPVPYAALALGASYEWDATEKTVTLKT